MALGAIHAAAEEDPELLGHHQFHVGAGPDEVFGGSARPLGGDPLLGHQVVRLVGGQALPHPLPVVVSGEPDAEEIRPAKGPIVNVLGGIEQDFDQLLPLVRVPAGQELPDPLGRRQRSRHIQADAPEKLGIFSQRRGSNVESLQLVKDFIVDKTIRRQPRETGQGLADHAEAGMGHLACRPNQDHGLTGASPLHLAAGTHLQYLSIQRFIANLLGKVFPATVREISRDQHLVAALLKHHRFLRKNLQPADDRIRPRSPAIGSAGSDPTQDCPVVAGTSFKPHAPTMGQRHGRFQQEEAVFGCFEVDAWISGSAGLVGENLIAATLDNPVVIFSGMHGIGGEPKTAPALHAPVTTAAIATLLGQYSGNVGDEADRIRPLGMAGPDRGQSTPAAQRRPESGLSVGYRDHLTFRTQAGHLRVGNREGCLRRYLPIQAVRARRQHQKALAGASSRKHHLLRHQAQGDNPGRGLPILGQNAARTECPEQTDRQAEGRGNEVWSERPIPLGCRHDHRHRLFSGCQLTDGLGDEGVDHRQEEVLHGKGLTWPPLRHHPGSQSHRLRPRGSRRSPLRQQCQGHLLRPGEKPIPVDFVPRTSGLARLFVPGDCGEHLDSRGQILQMQRYQMVKPFFPLQGQLEGLGFTRDQVDVISSRQGHDSDVRNLGPNQYPIVECFASLPGGQVPEPQNVVAPLLESKDRLGLEKFLPVGGIVLHTSIDIGTDGSTGGIQHLQPGAEIRKHPVQGLNLEGHSLPRLYCKTEVVQVSGSIYPALENDGKGNGRTRLRDLVRFGFHQ